MPGSDSGNWLCGIVAPAHDRFWHKTDVAVAGVDVALWGNADKTWKRRHFRF